MAANPRAVTPAEAHELILRAGTPAGLVVEGDLEFDGASGLSRLPHDLRILGRLSIRDCDRLRSLPRGLRCDELLVTDSGVTRLSECLHVSKKLAIVRCPLTKLPRKLRSGPLELLRLVESPRMRELPAGLRVTSEYVIPIWCGGYTTGSLDVRGCARLRALPSGLRLHALDARGCVRLKRLPDDLRVSDTLDLSGCAQLEELPGGRWPAGLWVGTLKVSRCSRLRAIPANLRIRSRLIAAHCAGLESLPEGLDVSTIDLRGCTRLRALPTRLRVSNLNLAGCASLVAWPPDGLPATLRQLDISGCTNLTDWPASGPPVLRRLTMRGCLLDSLPPWLRQVNKLDIRDCPNLRELSQGLRVPGWIELTGTPLQNLPPAARGCRVRWRGVLAPWRVALQPETITARAVLVQANAEVRRVMIERMGFERFLREARAETLDEDYDAGGPRQLLRVAIPNDEPLVCLSVRDPSTGRHYLLRVPPRTTGCRQAAAWIAGFDDPDDYHPAAET